MVKDAIGLWEKKQLNQESKDIVCMKTCQKEQNLSLVKSAKKQQGEIKPTKLPQEMGLLHQLKSTEKQSVFGPFKELQRKELGRQFKDARRKVLPKAAKNPTQQDVQEKEIMHQIIDRENQVRVKTSDKKENVRKEKAKSQKDEAKPKKDMAQSKKQTPKSKKDSSQDIAPPHPDTIKKDVATCCNNDNNKQNVTVQVNDEKLICQDKNIGIQEDLVYMCEDTEDIKENKESLCKNTEKYDMIYIGKDPKQQTVSCCYGKH